MKKIIISLGIIGVVGAVVIGATVAYFNDVETSSGNILVAGTLDLKVDHVWQTYNDTTCNTCDLTLISDESNMVVKKNGVPLASYPAVFVGSKTPFFIHSAWTAQNHPILADANAKWIWEDDPTDQADIEVDTTYTFRKTFEWYGPVITSDLWFAVGSDNSVEVWLNGEKIAENTGEYGYKLESMLEVPGAVLTNKIDQGENTLEFVIKNFAQPGGNYSTNPAGLIYKFYLSGDCQDNYFKEHCTLFGEKDLIPGEDYFFRFNDVKPGDHGRNVISLHVYDNDAWACLIVGNKTDDENGITDSESKIPDQGEPGELSQNINVFGWTDNNHNGIYEPDEETELFSGSLADPVVRLRIADSTTDSKLIASTTYYVGFAWCAGTQNIAEDGTITCDGSTMGDIAQSDSLIADLTAYIEQWRNNSDFDCSDVVLP